MLKFTCTKDLSKIIRGKKIIADTKKTLCSNHIIEKDKLRKYLSSLLSILIDEEDLEKITNQFINYISNFNKEDIVQCYKETKPNKPEEPRYISSVTPTRFINGKYG